MKEGGGPESTDSMSDTRWLGLNRCWEGGVCVCVCVVCVNHTHYNRRVLAYTDLHVGSASVPAMHSLLGDEGNELLIISPLLQRHAVMTEDLRGWGKWVWLIDLGQQ